MSQKGKVTSIANDKSPYFREPCKILQLLPDEQAEVFLLQEEIIIVVQIKDLSIPAYLFVPKTRKDLYEFIQKPNSSRSDLIKTLQKLLDDKILILNNGLSWEDFQIKMENPAASKSELVEELRKLRDEGFISLNLINSSPAKIPFKKRRFR